MTKPCTRCEVAQDISEFSICKLGKDGRSTICKSCRRIENRDRARTHRKVLLKFRDADPEHYLTPLLSKWKREEITGLRVCGKCRLEKPMAEFEQRGKGRIKPHSYCDSCRLQYRKDYRQKNPDKQKDASFRFIYGVGRSAYIELNTQQDGKCAICFIKTKLQTDHDHQSGLIRGLLCGRCNRGLGMFRDNPALLQAATGYLFRSQFAEQKAA